MNAGPEAEWHLTKRGLYVSKLSDSQNWKCGNWIQISSMKKGFDYILCKYRTVAK